MWYSPAVKPATWLAHISSFQPRCATVSHTWSAGSTRYIATAPECLCSYHRHLHWTDKLVTPLAKNTPLHPSTGRWLRESCTSKYKPQILRENRAHIASSSEQEGLTPTCTKVHLVHDRNEPTDPAPPTPDTWRHHLQPAVTEKQNRTPPKVKPLPKSGLNSNLTSHFYIKGPHAYSQPYRYFWTSTKQSLKFKSLSKKTWLPTPTQLTHQLLLPMYLKITQTSSKSKTRLQAWP